MKRDAAFILLGLFLIANLIIQKDKDRPVDLQKHGYSKNIQADYQTIQIPLYSQPARTSFKTDVFDKKRVYTTGGQPFYFDK